MSDGTQRVRVEELDWHALLPVMKLFGAFRMAVHPPKLLLGLLLVLSLWLWGRALDGVSGPRVHRGEFSRHAELEPKAFEAWLEGRERWAKGQLQRNLIGLEGLDAEAMEALLDSPRRMELGIERIESHLGVLRERLDEAKRSARKEAESEADEAAGSDKASVEGKKPAAVSGEVSISRLEEALSTWRQRLRSVEESAPQGVFATMWEAQAEGFNRLIAAATRLDFGFGQLLRPELRDRDTVVGALLGLGVDLPCWMLRRHCWFGLFYLAGAVAVWSLLGGTICRIAALGATRDERVTTTDALRFTCARWGWFAVTPFVPVLVAGVLGVALMVGGLVFNLPVFDMVGGVLFFLALLAGAGIAALALLQAAGVHLFYPSLATEGTDAFDAISRAFGYVTNRPWQWLFYTLVSLVYGAVTYLVVGAVIFLTIWFTRHFAGQWVVRDAAEGLNRFEAILPEVEFGNLSYETDWSQMSFSAKATAALVSGWVHLVFALLGAFAVSYYFCASTWIYLLLRRSCDGTEYDDVYIEEPEPDEPPRAPAAPQGSGADGGEAAPEEGGRGGTPSGAGEEPGPSETPEGGDADEKKDGGGAPQG